MHVYVVLKSCENATSNPEFELGGESQGKNCLHRKEVLIHQQWHGRWERGSISTAKNIGKDYFLCAATPSGAVPRGNIKTPFAGLKWLPVLLMDQKEEKEEKYVSRLKIFLYKMRLKKSKRPCVIYMQFDLTCFGDSGVFLSHSHFYCIFNLLWNK